MAYSWLKLDNRMVDHPKTKDLQYILKDKKAGWYIIRLFSWAHAFAPTGIIPMRRVRQVESACEWEGPAGELIAALVEAKWLEPDARKRRWAIHDWADFQGGLVEKSARDAADKKMQRMQKRSQKITDPHAKSSKSEPVSKKTARAASNRRDETRREEITTPPTPSSGPRALPAPKEAVHEGDEHEGTGGVKLEETQATVFVNWARLAAKKLHHPIGEQTPGHTVWTSTRYFFLKHGATEENQIRLRAAFLDFALTMKKSGWGMWLGNNVWEPRYNDVVAGAHPELFKLMEKLDSKELLEQTALQLGPLNAIGAAS